MPRVSLDDIAVLRAGRERQINRSAIAGLLLVATTATVTWASTRPPTVAVVVTAREVDGATSLRPADVRVTQVPAGAVPATALRTASQAVGRRLSGSAGAGEVLTARRLAAASAARSSLLTVGLAVDPATAGMVQAGDRVDVFATRDDAAPAAVVGRALEVAGTRLTSGSAEAVVYVRVLPQDAPMLLAAKARRALTVALREG